MTTSAQLLGLALVTAVCCLALPATADADVQRMLWVPSEHPAADVDSAVLDALEGARDDLDIVRCLATYEQLRTPRCGRSDDANCLARLGNEAGAELVLLRRVEDETLHLTVLDRASVEVRSARLPTAAVRRTLADGTWAWLVHGRVPVGPTPVALPADDVDPISHWRFEGVRRYLTRDGVSVLALVRSESTLDVAARPRGLGGVVALRGELR